MALASKVPKLQIDLLNFHSNSSTCSELPSCTIHEFIGILSVLCGFKEEKS